MELARSQIVTLIIKQILGLPMHGKSDYTYVRVRDSVPYCKFSSVNK